MKIIEPSAELIVPQNNEGGITALKRIEYLGRISHRTEDKQTDDSYIRFLNEVVIKHGDWSICEHAYATVIFRVDRGLTHEIVRHRHFSYTQESTRFVRYGGKQVPELEFVLPHEFGRCQMDPKEYTRSYKYAASDFSWACAEAEKSYYMMLENGIRPQEARSVLPNALASTLAMTGNLRAWRWFFLARTTQETHPDLRAVTTPLLETFKQRIPILYQDVEPNLKQSVSMGKVH